MATTGQGDKSERIKKVSIIMDSFKENHPDKDEEFLGDKFSELLDSDEIYLDELLSIIKKDGKN